MTYPDAISQLRDGKAAKTSTMKGYVKRVDAVKTAGDTWDSKFTITFVESSDNFGDGDNTALYPFVHETTAGVTTVTAPTPDLKMDALLYQLMLRTDWTICDTADAETQRTGTGRRW